jgi:putative thymidine phosphorylase
MTDDTSRLSAIDTIKKKLLGKKVTYKEVFNLMDEISHHKMSDILTTYFVAASFKEGLIGDELYYITKAMVETGNKITFDGIVADKHSIGGVAGTRATMILVPIVAAAGFKIPKISSRAITTPAGTADTMELLAQVNFPIHKVHAIVEKVGGCIVWNGTMGIAPADDIIIKVEEPLSFESFDKIIVSVMAKKIAVGTNHLVIDLPLGPTMKLTHLKDAQIVARKFEYLADKFGIKLVVDIVKTHEPAGNGIGPLLEARDVLKVLEQKEDRPLLLEKRALELAGKLLDICYKDSGEKKNGFEEASSILQSGQALAKFKEIIKAQEGNDQITSEQLVPSSIKHHVLAPKKGTLFEINNLNLNAIAKILGAPKDKLAGMYLHKKLHDTVEKNEPIITFYSSDKYNLKEAIETYKNIAIYGIK